MTISKAGARRKGHNFERQIARKFREVMPDQEIHRGLQGAGAREADVEVPYFWIECKRMKRAYPKKALDQAIGDAPVHRCPVAITQDDRKKALVTLTLDDFLELVSEWWALRNQ